MNEKKAKKVYVAIDASAEGCIKGIFDSREGADKCKENSFDPSYIIIEEHFVSTKEDK